MRSQNVLVQINCVHSQSVDVLFVFKFLLKNSSVQEH